LISRSIHEHFLLIADAVHEPLPRIHPTPDCSDLISERLSSYQIHPAGAGVQLRVRVLDRVTLVCRWTQLITSTF
jgi:hypothetical protein